MSEQNQKHKDTSIPADEPDTNKWDIKESYVWAGAMAVMIGLWILSGQIGSDSAQSAIDPNDASALSNANTRVAVRARVSQAQPYVREVIVRGRTESLRTVVVRAETAGSVISVPIEKGAQVKKGDVLCKLALDAREARKVQAQAKMHQAQLEYEAAKKLRAKGHRSETQEAAAEAAFNAAEAMVKEITIEIEHTKIRAPFDGVLDDRAVEVGDFVSVGDPCGTIIDQQPFLIVGQVSEAEVAMLQTGSKANAQLLSGDVHEGTIRFIGKRADPKTRTFRVELEVPNQDLSLRDGITAEIRIPTKPFMVHNLAPSSLVLNDAGQVGIRVVDDDNRVVFQPVTILADDTSGVWVQGPVETIRVITVGQEYTKAGQTVSVTLEDNGAES